MKKKQTSNSIVRSNGGTHILLQEFGKTWDELMDDIITSPTLNIFKSRLKEWWDV